MQEILFALASVERSFSVTGQGKRLRQQEAALKAMKMALTQLETKVRSRKSKPRKARKARAGKRKKRRL
jgi:hypothetical protein